MSNVVTTFVVRSLQILLLLAILFGLSQIPALVTHLGPAVGGQAKNYAPLAAAIAWVTGPITISLAIIVALNALLTNLTETTAFKEQYPEQPWMWRKDWAEKHIRLSNRGTLLGAILVGAIYLLFAVPLAVVLGSQKNPWVVGGFCGALGLVLLAFARMLWINRRWGRSELQLATLPGVIGGPFSGVIILAERFPEGTNFRVSLLCEETRTHRSRHNKNSTTQTSTVWQADRRIDKFLDAGRPDAIGLPVYFAIPYASEPTGKLSDPVGDSRRERAEIRWYVKVELVDDPLMRGVRFEVPVFLTAESSRTYREDKTLIAPYLEQVDPTIPLKEGTFRRVALPDGERLEFSLFSWKLLGALLIVSLTCGAFIAGTYWFQLPSPAHFFLALIPGAVLAIIVFSVFEMLFWSSSITILPKTIIIRAGYFWNAKDHTMARFPPPTIQCVQEFKQQTNPPYCLKIQVNPAVNLILFKRIKGSHEAQALRDWLVKQMAERKEER